MKINLSDIGLEANNFLPNSIPIRANLKSIKNDFVIPTIIEPPKQTYGTTHNELPALKLELSQTTNKDSIIDKIKTGFGDDNTLHKECVKPKWNQHLSKENYLSEFSTELLKLLARDNLGVYSKELIDKALKDITHTDTYNYITKSEVLVMIADADYIKANLKKCANYDIPNDLF